MNIRSIMLVALVAMSQTSSARADGGTLRLNMERGEYQVSVFTSPTTPRVGPLDVSVVVQKSASGETVLELPVTVIAYLLGTPDQIQSQRALTGSATNKLMHAAQIQLNQAGDWHIEVVVNSPNDSLGFGFDLEVTEAVPAWVEWGAWLVLPYLAFALYLIRRGRIKRRAQRARTRDVSPKLFR